MLSTKYKYFTCNVFGVYVLQVYFSYQNAYLNIYLECIFLNLKTDFLYNHNTFFTTYKKEKHHINYHSLN